MKIKMFETSGFDIYVLAKCFENTQLNSNSTNVTFPLLLASDKE